METRKDFVEREIERVGIFLRKLLSRMANVSSQEHSDSFELVALELSKELNFDTIDLLEGDPKAKELFTQLHPSHQSLIFDLMMSYWGTNSEQERKEQAQVLIGILDHMEAKQIDFSFKWVNQREKLSQELK